MAAAARALSLLLLVSTATAAVATLAEHAPTEHAPSEHAPPIFALHPAGGTDASAGDGSGSEEHAAFVLRAARQLRVSMYALTRQLPLLPCCGASSQDPAELLAASDSAAVTAAVGSAGPIRSIVVGVRGSAALDAVRADLRSAAVDADLAAAALLDDRLRSLGLVGGDDHLVHALDHGGGSVLFCVGASPIAAVYAVSTALEQLGIRFHLHGDSMPRPGGRTPTLESALETLAPVQLLQQPSMAVRGILPFHDFAHGPDWWTLNDYLFTMEQLAKMKMNFFGLHTYQQVGDPENPGTWGNWTEPAVWTGLKEDVNADGTVKRSYTAGWTTSTGHVGENWIGQDYNTSAYDLGSWQIYDADCYDGSHVHDGFCQKYHDCEHGEGGQGSPPCLTMNESNALFNRVGTMFSAAFTYAKESNGIQVALGTEAPMTYPPLDGLEPACDGRVNNGSFVCVNTTLTQQYYEGIFTRLVASKQPIAYYWIFNQEGWRARDNPSIPVTDPDVQRVLDDMLAAERAWQVVKPPFKLATNGWSLGPGADQAYWDKKLPTDTGSEWAMSTQGEGLGRADVLGAYGQVKRKNKWVIPVSGARPLPTNHKLQLRRTISVHL